MVRKRHRPKTDNCCLRLAQTRAARPASGVKSTNKKPGLGRVFYWAFQSSKNDTFLVCIHRHAIAARHADQRDVTFLSQAPGIGSGCGDGGQQGNPL